MKSVAAMPVNSDSGVPYQVEDDVRTLHRAEQIKKDKKRHGAAKAHAKTVAKQHMAVAGVEPDTDD